MNHRHRFSLRIFIVDILVRLFLWFLFIWLNDAQPFHRHIAAEEVWLYKFPGPSVSYIPVLHLWLLVLSFPASIFALEYFYSGFTDDIKTGLWALSLVYGLNGFVTSYLKLIVGRPRPDFYYRCFPEGIGDDFSKCTGDMKSIIDGRKSFPSGHASFSFTCMVFMSCYIARKVSLWSSTTGQSWRLCAVIAPLLIAVSIAISRTCDYHHHYTDIIFGSIMGTCFAGLAYYSFFSIKDSQEKPDDGIST